MIINKNQCENHSQWWSAVTKWIRYWKNKIVVNINMDNAKSFISIQRLNADQSIFKCAFDQIEIINPNQISKYK